MALRAAAYQVHLLFLEVRKKLGRMQKHVCPTLGAIAARRWHECLCCHEARARWCPVLPSIFARFLSATQPMAMEVLHVLLPDIWWAIVAYLLPRTTHGSFRGARMGNIILDACKGHLAETVVGICPDSLSLFEHLRASNTQPQACLAPSSPVHSCCNACCMLCIMGATSTRIARRCVSRLFTSTSQQCRIWYWNVLSQARSGTSSGTPTGK